MATRVAGLTGATIESAPSVCQSCVWWQSRTGREADKQTWIYKVEEEWGSWGSLYYDDDGRLLGFMQFGPAHMFPRAAELPAGPPSDDAVLLACAYVVDLGSPWVLKSLVLTAIGEARDRGVGALETFAYRYPEGDPSAGRLHEHKTVFPRDFLSDFGFRTIRALGRVELVRLELGGLQPVLEGRRARVLRQLKQLFQPAPVPQRP